MKYLLDTNIISEPMKLAPHQGLIDKLALNSIFCCTSATVWHELCYGVKALKPGRRQNELTSYLDLLQEDGIEILPYCQRSAEWLAEERAQLKAKGIIPAKYDCEIAAVAVVNKLILVTRNVDDFRFFSDLDVTNWFV